MWGLTLWWEAWSILLGHFYTVLVVRIFVDVDPSIHVYANPLIKKKHIPHIIVKIVWDSAFSLLRHIGVQVAYQGSVDPAGS